MESNPRQGFLWLCFVYGIPLNLSYLQKISLGSQLEAVWLVLIALVLAFPIGWISLQLGTVLVYLTGKLVKGQADYIAVRAAYSWPMVLSLVSIAMWILLIGTFGQHIFFAKFAEYGLSGFESTVLIFSFVVEGGFGLWSFVLLMYTLSEVQKFSGWMALLNVILAAIFMALIVWGVSSLIYLIANV